MDITNDVVGWLLEGDPAITWQTRHDLLDDPAGAAADRARVAVEGWGARMLGHQDPGGTWGNAIYSPKWTSTTYSLLELYRYGLDADHPAARRGVEVLLDRMRYIDGGLTPAKTVPEPEICVTGMMVQLDAYFRIDDPRADDLVDWLVGEQLADGGWNCDTYRTGSTNGSFHTTITVLEAFRERGERRPDPRMAEAAARGREFFLEHRLYHSRRTGAIADDVFTRFSFPPRWHFDALRGLDYFQASRADRDDRLSDAIELVHARRRKDGTWPLQNVHRNCTWFTMERGGQPSRWNTLRALRVLRWWEDQQR